MEILARWARRLAAGIVLILFGYATAGMLGGAIPRNAGWRPPADGIHIFIESNGVHTGIIVPKVAAGIDWRGLARAGDLRDPRYAGYDHLSFGWGERTFYLETPTWADVKPSTILAAAIGSDRTLIHVDHIPRPRASSDVRELVVTPDQYRRLAAYIAASFRPDGAHQPGYAAYDAFYDATGHYSALTTCNSWTGTALRQAGIRVGAWTPFPATVTGWF